MAGPVGRGEWLPVSNVRQLDRRSLATAGRVVVKVGSSSLTGADGRLDVEALRALVDVLAERRLSGRQVVLVTSGAIASGLAPLGLASRPGDLATAQATASVGQGLLIARYTEAFAMHGLRVGQVLLTAEDTVRRSHYRNALRCLDRLLALGVVPIINENDTVATSEIRFGENDRLAALVSHLVRADALVLLSDVDGLYDRPPTSPGATRIDEVRDPAELVDVKVGGSGSKVGSGGMVSKLQSVAIATGSGVSSSTRAPCTLSSTAAPPCCRPASRPSRGSSTRVSRWRSPVPTASSWVGGSSPSRPRSCRTCSAAPPASCARPSARGTTGRSCTATTWCS